MKQDNLMKNNAATYLKDHLILPALVFFWLILMVSNPAFGNLSVYSDILKEGAMFAVCGIGMTFAIISGGMDLSIASQIALSSVIFTKIVGKIMPGCPGCGIIASCVIILALGCLMGLANGLMIARLRIPPFIATLATMNVFRGLAQLVSDSPVTIQSIGEKYLVFSSGTEGHHGFATAEILGLPLFFYIMVILAIVGTVVLRRTRLGRNTLAIGNSRDAARLAGVSIPNTLTAVYVWNGLFTAIAAIMMTANLGSSNYGVPTGTEFTVISAVVLGGTALAGGAGSIFNTVVAAIFLATISTALNAYGVGNNVYGIFRGCILVFAFSLYTIRLFAARKPANAKRLQYATAAIVALLIIAAVGLGIHSRGAKSADDGKLVFGWSVYDMSNPFFIPMDAAVREQCEALGVKLLPTHDQKGDATEMVTGVSALIAQGIDALLVSPCSPESMSAITAKAAKANIPVVVLDIGTGGAKSNAFLRSDMYGGGAKAGRYFLDVMKQGLYPDITSKKVAIIKCETSATYAITRGEGFKSAVVPAGYTVVEEQHGNSNKNEAYKIMRVYINKYKNDLAAVFCENDEMAMGAIAAVDEAGLTGKLLIYGFDGNDDAKAAIKEKKLGGTVAQDSHRIGAMGTEIAYKIVKGEKIEASEVDKDGNNVFLVPVSMIDRDGNVLP